MKQMKEDKKMIARVGLLTILLLQLMVKTYDLFQLDVILLNRMMRSIDDMSLLFTIIC